MILKRIENLRKMLRFNEAALIFSETNRFYFSGFESSAGAVIITQNDAYLAVDFRYFENAKNKVNGLKVVMFQKLYKKISEILNLENVKLIYIETDYLTLDKYSALTKNLDSFKISKENKLSQYIEELRSIKAEEEKGQIVKAQELTDKAFTHILNFIEVGRTEAEIALELEFFMRKSGSEGVAFDTIAVSGKNSSLPHGVPTDKKIENGDFITMDFGAVVNGYRSDMTRTVAVGKITDKQCLVYETVLKAQKAALEAIKPNTQCNSIDKIARDIIDNAGFNGCFGHGLGHSVGLEIHENPSLNTRDITLLKRGMVLTVEPGIYIENEFGVRIEDMVYLTDGGVENLTKSPKELIIL